MSSLILRLRLAFACTAFVSGTVALTFLQDVAVATSTTLREATQSETQMKHKFKGSSTCAYCHEVPNPRNPSEYCDLTEFAKWNGMDKHSQAFDVLKLPRSKQIGDLLKIKDVTTAAECISCHSVRVDKDLQGDAFRLEDGVSCDACHGPASEWVSPHLESSWRVKPWAEKEKLGMKNVRDPIAKSTLCLSCHVGNVKENKVVRHDMYAAGHPPLPGLEISGLADAMPRHWKLLAEKPESIKKLLGYQADRRDRTKLVLVGGMMTLRQSIRFSAELAESAGKTPDSAIKFPELAAYDCAACHHDLVQPSARQARGYSGTPGRPRVRDWGLIVTRVAAKNADADLSALQKSLETLDKALDARPFGDPSALANASKELDGWLDQTIQNWNKRPTIDPATAMKVLRDLCEQSSATFLDYDGARQIAWSVRAVFMETDLAKSNDALKTQIDALVDSVTKTTGGGKARRDALNKRALDEFNKLCEAGLEQSMKASSDFDAVKFKRDLEAISKALAR